MYRRFRVYKEAPGYPPGPRNLHRPTLVPTTAAPSYFQYALVSGGSNAIVLKTFVAVSNIPTLFKVELLPWCSGAS